MALDLAVGGLCIVALLPLAFVPTIVVLAVAAPLSAWRLVRFIRRPRAKNTVVFSQAMPATLELRLAHLQRQLKAEQTVLGDS